MMPFYNKINQPCVYQTWEKCTKQIKTEIIETSEDWLAASCGEACHSPPPAHQHGPHPLLWRVNMEPDPSIELWQEQTQEIFTVSFQDIVDILMKGKKQQEAESEVNECVDDGSSDISGVPKKRRLVEELSNTAVNNGVTNKRKLNDDIPVQETQLMDSQVGHIRQVRATKSGVRPGGNFEVDIKSILKDIDTVLDETSTVMESIVENHYGEDPLEDKEEDPLGTMAAECNTEDSGTEMKERRSNSDRCRMFRKKSKRTRQTNEQLLIKLEKRNGALNEAEKKLMTKREVLQTQYLSIVGNKK